MRFRRRVLEMAAAALLLALGAGINPAAAQFYSLEGRFQCLDRPGAVCFDATSDRPAKKPAAPRPSVTALAELEPAAGPAPRHRAKPVVKARLESADPLVPVIARLKLGRTAPGDIALLQSRVRQDDVRAIELLAWATLKGIGVARDPTRAYLLYGVAARLGVANAKRNQAIVYETMMNSEQRQRALAIEDEALTPPPR